MNTNIIVNLQIEGLHRWKEAKEIFPAVAFLSNFHRHVFWITCKKRVNHSDRNVEFILYKRKITKYLNQIYSLNEDSNCLHFGGMSCEMIAKELLDKFELEYCSVMEDNENGAEVYV